MSDHDVARINRALTSMPFGAGARIRTIPPQVEDDRQVVLSLVATALEQLRDALGVHVRHLDEIETEHQQLRQALAGLGTIARHAGLIGAELVPLQYVGEAYTDGYASAVGHLEDAAEVRRG
jgi:hypothetical protein